MQEAVVVNCTSENVATSYINLLKEVAIAANEAIGVEAALRLALRSICRATGWPVGHALKIQSGGSLRSTGIWHVDEHFPNDHFTAFRQASEAVCFPAGIGLPGRVLAEGLPLGMSDASTDANFPRRATALQADLAAGFALPVRSGNSITAVLEFFAPIARQPSPELLD
ncbi:MAG: GAF domain-containing protein, partial [Pseudomonas sp.]